MVVSLHRLVNRLLTHLGVLKNLLPAVVVFVETKYPKREEKGIIDGATFFLFLLTKYFLGLMITQVYVKKQF
jgi:hypothetical protein